MEGYLWKRGRKVPSMKRHYAVLKGTMLAFYASQDEAQRSGAAPKRVLEVTDLRIQPGTPSSDTSHPPHVVLRYLDADGSGTLQCRADSRETQQLWLEALQHALKEPDRLAQDEINEVQEELLKDAQRHTRAIQQATEAVEAAGRHHREQANAEAALQQNREIAVELNTQLETARTLQAEALQKLQGLQSALEEARQRVHASSLGSDEASSFDQAIEAVERLAAKLEVASSAEATHGRNVELLQLQTEANSREQQELVERVQKCAEESKILRQIAAKSLEDAQRAKQRTKRLASWGDETRAGAGAATRPSQLDPLAEGYLLCQHPMRTSMHRRYYVLTGNTLCWYADQDAFLNKMDAPSGVLHVAEVAEWDGKVKPTSPLRRLVVPFSSSSPKSHSNEQHPHPFAVLTVEGKTLRCSAPLKKSQEDWISALHVGLTMPPLSPHRARAAKSRRDSFDLLASTPMSPKRQSSDEASKLEAKASTESTSSVKTEDNVNAAETAELTSEVVVEGYLVGKSSLEETMKKKYCVLRALTLYVFTTHQEAATASAPESAQHQPAIRSATFHVCGVSSWDGHATLMHYDHGFLLQTTEHQSIYCSAPSLQEKNRWVSGVQQALLRYQHDTKRGSKMFGQFAASEDEEKADQPQRRLSYATARREFLAILQRYYAEYHPSKLGDVPMLLSRYQGREQALVEHLDRLYGTSMGKDGNVQVIFTALVNPVPPSSPHPAPSTFRAPPSPVTRVSGDLTDWLTWNKDSSASFCILSGNRLERFESEEQSKSGSSLAVFLVTGVHDYPTPSPTMNRSKMTDQQLQFFLSGGYEVESQGLGSSTELLVLQATTAEAKQKWMLKLRSGLTTTPPKPSVPQEEPSSSASTKAEPPPVISTQATTFQEKLVEFYQRHNPKRVGDVETLLTSFAGRERQLLAALDATYGTNASSDGSFDAFLPQPSPPNARSTGQNTTVHREGYLYVKHPRLGASYRKCFCVLNGTNWQCFDSSVVAHSGHAALLADVVVSLHPVSAKLAESMAFRLETQTNGVIMLRSDAAEILHDWIHALRTAVTSPPSNVDLGDAVTTKEGAGSSFQQLRARIVAFYEKHNPSKVSDVESLLISFQGREGALLEQIDTVYKSQLATDPECTSLCADLASKYAKEHIGITPSKPPAETPAGEVILMEGYLMKRGHKIPSMRKRYCVLVGTRLSYYVTHDDSKNPGGGAMTAPLGSFHIEVVGDWHGKTATHNYEYGMELETSDGKTFFCAASTAKEKQQWVDAFRRGIALARTEKRRAEIEGENDESTGESEHERQLREQFREKLADFYRVRNPAKLPDLDLLLSCYAQRELALLQAIDDAYGTILAADENLLALLPQLPEHATALATLKLDGYLKKTSGDNSHSLWKRAQTVYVAVDSLTVSLFATREGFKSGGAGLGESMTVLAVKDDDTRQSAASRFAVETSDHEWLRFEACDTMEKRLWMQVLRAALDTVLAQSLLADDQSLGATASNTVVDARGFLLLRLDFDCTQEEHWKRREIAMSIEERAVALENGNEFVITKASSSLKQVMEQARFRVVSTRAWSPIARCWPVTASNRAPRFPFQIVTQEQFVLSCSAATDAERAKWIRQLRLGAEQAAALEMLEEQLLETQAPISPGRRSLVDKREHGFNDEGEVLVAPEPVVLKHQEDEEPPMTGYLSFRMDRFPLSSGEARHASQVPIPHEGFVVLTMRAHVAVYEDESAYYRRDASACEAQAVELLPDGVTSINVSAHSPKTKAQLRHLFPGAKDALPLSLVFAVLLHPLREGAIASVEDMNNDHEKNTALLEFFPTLPSQRDLWTEAFASRIDFARGEALLADERMMLRLERDEEEIVEDKKEGVIIGGEEETHTGSNGDDSSGDDSGFEDKPLTIDVSMATEDVPARAAPMQRETAPSFVFRTAAMEGMLIPWQTSTSPIRLPGSSKLKPMMPVYAILVGCRLRCYESREGAAASASASSSRRNLLSSVEEEDKPACLDVEITACSSWDAPATGWLSIAKENENLGLKVDVKGSRHSTCFTAATAEAKHQWIQVIQHELNFVVAERSLSMSERQFTEEVAAHLSSIAAAAEACSDSTADVVANVSRTVGYLRVRHHNLGSIWRERFLVLEGSTLSIYSENCDLDAQGKPRFPNSALEKHELVGVEKWHPVFTSIGRSGSGLKGTGFRGETSSGVYLECTAKSADDASRWQNAISAATTKETSEGTVSRDATLPFIPGARMEGYLKLKDLQSSTEKKMKMKPLKLWKTRYCVVMGPHWLVYANQSQAISSADAPTPVAVYELLGIAVADGVDDARENEFSIHVIPGRQVKCRARSSLERKRWVNAVEDELMTQAKTTEVLERSVKERELKLAAREAVKSKLHEVKSDARRLSAMLGEAIQSAREDSDSEWDSDVNENCSDDEESLRQRSVPDYIDGSPESSPMRRNVGESAFPFDTLDPGKGSETKQHSPPSSFTSFFACFFRCIPMDSSSSKGRNIIAPLGIPGYPSSAAVCNPQYTCDYYEDDGYRGLAK